MTRAVRVAVALTLALGAAPEAARAVECDGARPGAVLVVPLTPPLDPRPYPTFGFMFEGSDGNRYASTAGHVVLGLAGGERTWPPGSGTVAFDIDGNRVGTFVYAIDSRTAPHPDVPPGADLALIRVDATAAVEESVCGIGGPSGIDERVVPSSQTVRHEWFGATALGGRVGQPAPVEGPWLAPHRSGVSAGMQNEHWVTVAGYASFGDSGAPVLSAGGRAIGWISAPPSSSDELKHGGSFVVSRIAPAIARARRVLGIELTLTLGGA